MAAWAEADNLLAEQRGAFEALHRFIRPKNDRHAEWLSSQTGASFVYLIDDALTEKGALFGMVRSMIYPGEPQFESPLYGETRSYREHWRGVDPTSKELSEPDRILARYFKRNEVLNDVEHARLRAAALVELWSAIDRLSALAGELRAAVALFKADLAL
jgi:hypothetical protein